MSNLPSVRPGIWRETVELLRSAWSLVRAGGARLCALVFVGQLLTVGIAVPVIGWLFREALRSAGLHGLDLSQLRIDAGFTLTIGIIVAIIVLAFWLLALQFTALVVLLRQPRLSGRAFLRALGETARKLLRPGSLSLVFYLFLLVPLTGFGFASTFTQGISIPLFVPGELEKSTATAIGYAVVMLLLALLNLRLALTVPVFVLTTGGKAARASWRMTRGLRRILPIALACTAVLFAGGLVSVALMLCALMPTALSDVVAPGASHFVAAYSLGAAQVVGFMLTGLFTALIAGVLITATIAHADQLPRGVQMLPSLDEAPLTPAPRHRRTAALVTAGAVGVALIAGTAGIDTMQRLSDTPQSLVLAHRGFSDGGVENTISGLDAAKAAGADLVEMDVMQTRDGAFVAMHDATLGRLTGEDLAVKDLTLEELTAMTVHDRFGHEDRIPSFAEYAAHAKDIDMPLLVEIKLSGAETSDHVDQLIAELESLDALERNIYHSLDPASVNRLKTLRPDLTVGYTMAFAGVDIPDTPADFIVVEEWTATEKMQQAAHSAGLGFMAWTVNDEAGMREHLRRNTDGIISDHPDQVLALRDEMQEETGLADVLFDALGRFVTIV